MLILTRRIGESIIIGDDTGVTLLGVKGRGRWFESNCAYQIFS